MAFCGNYKGANRTPAEFTDKVLMNAVKSHLDPDFWTRYQFEPDRHAYVRQWARRLRREARRRGLL